MRKLKFVDLDYCMFSQYGYRKPTRFWTSDGMAARLKDVVCKGQCANMVEDDYGNRRHRLQIGGESPQRGSREEAYRIPSAVVEYLCSGVSPPSVDNRNQPQPSPSATIVAKHPDRTAPVAPAYPAPSVTATDSTTPTPSRVRKVMMKPWHHEPRRPFAMGRMEHRGGCYQLMMTVEADIGGHVLEAKALVDTGARTSLVRKDLLPERFFRRLRKPLVLKTVSGEELPGGKQEVELAITFAAHTDDAPADPQHTRLPRADPRPTTWTTTVVAHDGE